MKKLVLLFALFPTLALAQQPPTPKEQALSSRILFEIQSSNECNANLITQNQQLTAAQARIKELEGKANLDLQKEQK